MKPEERDALRKPFPASSIGKIPKGGAQLDYIGHAAVTDRLLAVDPEWNWEPMASASDGTPLWAINGNDAVMWIRLTVCGVTRLGVGIVQAKAFELEKQLISDALRNAAMRFGVALDLWSKEDLASGDVGVESSRPSPPARRETVPPIAGPDANTAASGPALPSDRDTTTLANIESMSPVALAEALRRRKAPDSAFGTPQQMRQALKKMLEQETT